MIKNILKAVNTRINEYFPTITIQSTDVKEGYKRPCFYVDVIDYTSEIINGGLIHKVAAFNILYFPSDPDRYKVEVLEIREQLQRAFLDPLQVSSGFNISILDTADTISDGVLNFDITIDCYVTREEEERPLIQELEFNTP